MAVYSTFGKRDKNISRPDNLVNLGNHIHAGIPKASSKKEWKLSDSLRERIAEYAGKDAAQNVYMGNKFLALRKGEVAKVAPDRAALMGKVSQEMADMKGIKEADERWLRLLFGEPYEAKFQSGAVHVYDGNGDEVLTYTAGIGCEGGNAGTRGFEGCLL